MLVLLNFTISVSTSLFLLPLPVVKLTPNPSSLSYITMSIIHSLVVSVLLFSFDACNARHLGAMNKDTGSQFHSSAKNNENMSLVKKLEAAENETSLEKTDVLGGIYNPKAADADENELTGQRIKTEGSDINSGPSGSITWRVPHEKERDQKPVFSADYSPPKTHPPHHN